MWTAKNFEEKMSPCIDDIYRDVFKDRILKISRSDRSDETDDKMKFLDIHLAIDTHVHFKDGSVLTFQEKTRRNQYLRYNDFTFEYYNDPRTKNEGEWFKLGAQLYFFGYANKDQDGYSKYWILNIPKLRTRLMSKYPIEFMEKNWLKQNPPPAKANFFAIPFHILESLEGVVSLKSN